MTTQLCPYLNFDGNARDAMEFYKSVFGGELTVQTFGEAPIDAAPEAADRVMHASVFSDDIVLMASDTMPGMEHDPGSNVHLSLVGPDEQALTSYFNSLAEGGSVTMPLEEQFWGDTFGMCTDKFGIHWMVNVGEFAPA